MAEQHINTPCPECGREIEGHWYNPCPSDDCPSHENEKEGKTKEEWPARQIEIEADGWGNDHLQFARVLAEMDSQGLFHEALCDKLCESMDLTPGELDNIIDRAKNAFDDYLKRYFKEEDEN